MAEFDITPHCNNSYIRLQNPNTYTTGLLNCRAVSDTVVIMIVHASIYGLLLLVKTLAVTSLVSNHGILSVSLLTIS